MVKDYDVRDINEGIIMLAHVGRCIEKGSEVAEILRGLVDGVSAAHKVDRLEKLLAEERQNRVAIAEALQNAREALGDGWHPLRCGGQVQTQCGDVVGLKTGKATKEATVKEAADLTGRCVYVDPKEWSKDGSVKIDPVPF